MTVTPSAVPPWTVALDANSIGNTDVSVQATNSPAKSFRVGAIINASSATPVSGVYGWQFGVTYDKTILVPQGDPVAGDASDGAQNTVFFGGQTGTGNPNWALMISGGRAFGSSSIVQVDATHEQIIVFFTIVAPNPAVTIGPSVSGNLLANVAFEIVGEPVDPVVLSITDVQFADLNALPIPNINAGPDITETISDIPPVANFTVTPLTRGDASCLPVTGSTCSLYAFKFDGSTSSDADGTIANPQGYFWDFGDGTQDNVNVGACAPLTCNQGPVAVHDYGRSGALLPGTFAVTLRVVDSQGDTGSARDSFSGVIVNHQPSHTSRTVLADATPTARFTFTPASPGQGQTVVFDGTTSADDGRITSYAWDFGDGNTGTGATPSHSFAAVGSYLITLIVTDNVGFTDTTSHTVIVTNLPPTVSFTESASTVPTGTSITLTITAADPDGTVSSLKVVWGDGTIDSLAGSSTSDTHSYALAGSYTLYVNATDNANLTTKSTVAVKTITDRPPTISFTESATTVPTGTQITLTVNAADPDGTVASLNVVWGDGTVDTLAGTVTTDTHAYASTVNAQSAAFTVYVNATDNSGSVTKSPTATNTITDRAPNVSFEEDKTTAFTGVSITLTIASSDVDGTVTGTMVSWGDGTVNNLPGAATSDSHSYSKAGSFKVTVTVTDDAGLTGRSQATKTISDRPPVASFSESSSTVLTGASISFDASTSNDPDGSIVTYSWAFGDGGSDTGLVVSHSYARAGTYVVTLTVTDDNGSSNSVTSTKTISDRPPGASFSESLSAAPTGTSIGFDASASSDPDGSIAIYAWQFGDGSTGAGVASSHGFAAAGTYTVTLTVTDDSGNTNSVSGLKTIIDRPPVAGFNESSTSVPTGTPVQFDASISSDADGTIAAYSWLFGDGSTGSGVTTSHSYSVAGPYTVTLTVTDDSGNTDTASALKTIVDRPPLASFSESATTSLTLNGISFDASASSDADGTIVSFAWNFGDGTMGTGQTTSHSYATAGTYKVTLTVTDDSSNSGTATATKTNTDRLPVARFSESATQALTQAAISFDASASSDVDGNIAIYAWNFGDGSTGSGSAVSHAYARAGSYTVNLTVTDDSGSTGTASAVKSIGDRPPVASFTASSTTIVVGNPLKLDASGSSDQDGTVTGFSWSFGDGSNGTGFSVSHVYNATGTFTIALVVIDDSGSTGSTSQVVPVTLPPKVLLTFQAYDAADFFKGVGALDVSLNSSLVVNIPGGLFQLSGTGHYAPLAKVWADFGPFEITGLVKLGTNGLVFSDPLPSHITPIRNVKVVTGDSTILLDHPSEEEVGPRETVTLNFSIPPIQISSFAVSPSPVFNTEVRTFTVAYEGGVGPFTCTFDFGDGGSAVVSSTTQACSAVHTYWLGDESTWWDAGGNFTATVGVVGANTGDSVVGTLPVEVLREPSFTANGLTWTSSVTTSVQTFYAQVSNPGHVDLLVRVDFSIYTPIGGTDPFTSPSFLVLAGQTRGNISLTYTPTAHGWYCYQGTLTYGRDLNQDGVLQDSEVLGTKHAEYGCFQVS